MLSQLVQSILLILLMDGDHCCNRTYHSDGDNLNKRGNLIDYQNAGRQEPPEQAPLYSKSLGKYVALAGGPTTKFPCLPRSNHRGGFFCSRGGLYHHRSGFHP